MKPARAAGVLRAHAAIFGLLALAAPLLVAFAWQPGLATFNDDSFSYLTLARWIEGSRTFVEPWAWQHAHFPPLFPLVLVATRGSQSLAAAHVTVALLAALALAALYRYALLETRSRAAACLLAAAFLLTPTAWLSILGVLSEPLFLAITLMALACHARHLAQSDAPPRRWIVFGLWLAAAQQTRSAAVTLIAAYAVHAALRFARTPRTLRIRLLLPFLPVLLLAPLWPWLRPGAGGDYQDQLATLAAAWAAHPAQALRQGVDVLVRAWLASLQGEGTTGGTASLPFLALGAIALAGTVRRAARNALDGWYVLLTLPLLVFWNYGEETSRRLLYPLLPLLLLHAGEALAALAARLDLAHRARFAVAACCALVIALCLPAMALLALRALDRTPLPGTSMAYSNVLEYYRSRNEVAARQAANPQLAALIGLQALRQVTEPDARVMWMRPEYVGLLGQRRGVPYEYGWDKLTFARALEATGTRYLVLSEIYKLDVDFALSNPGPMFADLARFSEPYYSVTLPLAGRAQFVLQRVDPVRLREYLRENGFARAP
ncbi:MAG TPA: hypothetical protein VFE23_13480 [Usitatibacter sp.]|jgi:hypothetical protein|nr:hypothetical protein [Usitatibacter sp.]